MTAKTHIKGGFTVAMLLYPFIVRTLNTVHLLDNAIKYMLYFIALILVTSAAGMGSRYNDYDQQTFNSVPKRNAVTYVIFKTMKFFGATHRSWHTHAIDVNLILFGIPTIYLFKLSRTYSTMSESYVIVMLCFIFMLTFTLSTAMHVFLDLYTIGGGYISIILSYLLYSRKLKRTKQVKLTQYKLSLAPVNFRFLWVKKVGNTRKLGFYPLFEDYKTGGEYEDGFRKMLTYLNGFGMALTLAYMSGLDLNHTLTVIHYMLWK